MNQRPPPTFRAPAPSSSASPTAVRLRHICCRAGSRRGTGPSPQRTAATWLDRGTLVAGPDMVAFATTHTPPIFASCAYFSRLSRPPPRHPNSGRRPWTLAPAIRPPYLATDRAPSRCSTPGAFAHSRPATWPKFSVAKIALGLPRGLASMQPGKLHPAGVRRADVLAAACVTTWSCSYASVKCSLPACSCRNVIPGVEIGVSPRSKPNLDIR